MLLTDRERNLERFALRLWKTDLGNILIMQHYNRSLKWPCTDSDSVSPFANSPFSYDTMHDIG